jgi:protein-S-isoprenylcysteine O-methyltransferase Ste14
MLSPPVPAIQNEKNFEGWQAQGVLFRLQQLCYALPKITGAYDMQAVRKWIRNPGILLFVSSAVVLIVCLLTFGAAHQNRDSGTLLSIPGLWVVGLIVLPLVFFLFLGWVWRRFDRIAR